MDGLAQPLAATKYWNHECTRIYTNKNAVASRLSSLAGAVWYSIFGPKGQRSIAYRCIAATKKIEPRINANKTGA